MKELLTENAVKDMLEISDWRHLSKNKILKFASSIHRMDPEVAKKCIDQFPRFSESTSTIIKYYYDLCDKQTKDAYKDSSESYKIALEAMVKELDKDDLTPEGRQFIIEQTVIIGENIERVDDKKTKFALALNFLAYGLAVAGMAMMGSLLGGNSRIPLPDFSKFKRPTS